jgi:hypothetical protein
MLFGGGVWPVEDSQGSMGTGIEFGVRDGHCRWLQ